MLDKALTFLQRHLNARLKGDAAEDRVVLAKVEKDYVHLSPEAVTVVLVGIEQETSVRAADPYRGLTVGGGVGAAYPEIRLNLSVLFAARFEAYENALGHISKVIRYFQRNPVLTPEGMPDMDPELVKLVMELHDLSLSQQNDMWNVLKIAVTPAVLYRVRLVSFQDTPVVETPKITEIGQGISTI